MLLIGSAKPNEFIDMYDNLSDSVKNGVFKEMLESRMLLAKQKLGLIDIDKLSKNILAPDFETISLNGDLVNLKDFRGKYVVLDFWGSWCVPCIKGIPQMKEYYNKYSSKIEFISIACKDNKNNVEKLINQNNLSWIQLLNNSSYDLSTAYKVTSYPTKVLIDDKGLITEVFIGESDEFYNKIDEIFEN